MTDDSNPQLQFVSDRDTDPKFVAEPGQGPVVPASGPPPKLSTTSSAIVKIYQDDYRIVGEEKTIAQIFYTGETRHLPREYRRHIVPQGEWGVGKSTILKRVLEPFSKDVKLYTRITGAGLDRMQDSLDGKILLYEQILGNGKEPMQLPFLMSEGKLVLLSAERSENGKMVSTETVLNGMPIVATTLTGANVEGQLASRVSFVKIDESDDQTGRITAEKLRQWAERKPDNEATIGWKIHQIDAKCRELGPSVKQILAPWAKKITDGIPKVLAMRRGLPMIEALVNAIAFVKAALGQRHVIWLEGAVKQAWVIAMPEDIEDAIYILGDGLTESASYFMGRSKEVYETLNDPGGEGLTSSQLCVKLKMSQNRAREYANYLVETNHATKEKVKNVFQYWKVPGSEPNITLSVEYSDAELVDYVTRTFPEPSISIAYPTPTVVFVLTPSELRPSTTEQIVPESSMIQPVVPDLLFNSRPHEHDDKHGLITYPGPEGSRLWHCQTCKLDYPDQLAFQAHIDETKVGIASERPSRASALMPNPPESAGKCSHCGLEDTPVRGDPREHAWPVCVNCFKEMERKQ